MRPDVLKEPAHGGSCTTCWGPRASRRSSRGGELRSVTAAYEFASTRAFENNTAFSIFTTGRD
ncbi:hypothetical protein PBCV1_a434aR [Paramecium bursaria Chlorella virus 1]|uniref:Uncharacterized protein n=1 Tax=Paramecium bursaria Chlorella virus 1 TaxID=10506 RepID=F8TU37_PBCV1|nr:hypothetical protein PBCV1_a434aR [Paramecium bursaria Chlorella virus 1]AEI70098.1 hypothetical protein [Paramecium bursaria Chlorella virus 1]